MEIIGFRRICEVKNLNFLCPRYFVNGAGSVRKLHRSAPNPGVVLRQMFAIFHSLKACRLLFFAGLFYKQSVSAFTMIRGFLRQDEVRPVTLSEKRNF